MISRSGKGNFFAAHYEWLAAGVGILALVGAGAFCFLGGDAEADIEAATVSISGRGKERAAVADADLTGCCRSTNVSKTVELARRIEDRFLGSFASEKRVFIAHGGFDFILGGLDFCVEYVAHAFELQKLGDLGGQVRIAHFLVLLD